MRIAIVVHGRFHAFDFARELAALGHEVALYTNYPRAAVRRFGVAPRLVRGSYWIHGLLTRLCTLLQRRLGMPYPEKWLNTAFARRAARDLGKRPWDVVFCWTGVGEEVFSSLQGRPTLKVSVRGSAHISEQARLLREESERTGAVIDAPSPWAIEREKREYEAADCIHVPSRFARDSFLREGIAPTKVQVLGLGVELAHFQASPASHRERRERILAGAPLRVLSVGTVSFRKGFVDLCEAFGKLRDENFEFRFVGPVLPEVQSSIEPCRSFVEFVPPRPQHDLVRYYEWGDVFILATIEDGYAMVLDQARAGGLPILATTNCGAPDFVTDGEDGWIIPIRSPDRIVEILRRADADREALAAIAERCARQTRVKDWRDVAVELVEITQRAIERRERAGD